MRSVLILICAAVLALGFTGRAGACSQCMCGTPFPSDVLGGVVPARFAYGLEERYLSKSNALDEAPGVEQEREHRVAAFGLWRPKNQLAFIGRVPFNFKEITARPQGDVSSVQRSRGLGDAEFLVLAGLSRGTERVPLSVGLVLGGVAPTGSNEVKDSAGERLDAHLQPGAGAWSGTAGLHAALASGHGTWDASLLGRTSGTNVHGYRYGDVLLYNAGFTSRTWHGLQLLAQINGRSAKRDRLEDGTPGENTGGAVTYAAPGLHWRTGVGVTAEAAVQVPIQQSLFGEQTEHATGRLTLTLAR